MLKRFYTNCELFGYAQKRGFGHVTGFANATPYRKFAFTMAEILIAMTILGVVALLTIPQIIGNTGGRSNKLMMQKSFATLSQSLKIAEAKMGYSTEDVETTINYTSDPDGEKSIENLLAKTMDLEKLDETSHPISATKWWKLGEIRYKTVVDGVNHFSNFARLEIQTSGSVTITNESTTANKYKNGAIFKSRDKVYYIFPGKEKIDTEGCTKNHPCLAYIDVNGPDSPNMLMECENAAQTAIWNQVDKQYQLRKAKFKADGSADTDTNGNQLYDSPAAAACTFDPMNTADIFAVLIYGGTVVPATNVDALVLESRE